MKKITLELDTLAVESFETVAAAAVERGTVRGHGTTIVIIDPSQASCDGICEGEGSQYATCEITCAQCTGDTCGNSCDFSRAGACTAYVTCNC